MNRLALAAAAAAAVSAGAAQAASNLVTNGSFEDGLAGWGISGIDGQATPQPPAAIFYSSAAPYPTGASGESVAPDDSASLSVDPAGNRAAYFVSDLAKPYVLSQFVTTGPGRYIFGFSAYAPANGLRNEGEAMFKAVFFGNELANIAVSSLPAVSWQHFTGSLTKTTTGTGAINFTFSTDFAPSKDIVIDRVYLQAVPEASTWAMLIAGFGLVGSALRRKRPTLRPETKAVA
jgi:hypothetical protein